MKNVAMLAVFNTI